MVPTKLCATLLYYSFNEGKQEETNRIKIIDFEKDIRLLLDLGYESLSINAIVSSNKYNTSLPEKSFCVIFQGGYEDNYRLAFPVIQRLGIYVSIFIDPDMVGAVSCTDDPNFISRFNWEQAKEMVDSGLVSIYAFWHPSDDETGILCDEINRLTDLIDQNIPSACSKESFYINTMKFETERIAALKKVGIESFIIAFWLMNSEKISSGAIPFTIVNQGANILDLIDEFNLKCKDMLKQEEDTFRTIQDIEKWDNSAINSIELKIDDKPLIKNYLRHAFPLSILGSERKDKAELVVLYEYIDVVFRPWYHWFDYDNTLYDCWDVINCSKLSRAFIIANKLNVLDCIVNGLYAGYYCDLWIDVYYIPGKYGYNKTHFTHNLLVYAYNKESDVFQALTYSNGQYVKISIKSHDISRSCSTDYFITANFIKVNKEVPLIYSTKILLERLKRYMQSQYTFSLNSKYNKYDHNQLCNRKACEFFSEYISSTAAKENEIDLVALYSFLEHKKCMGWRLKYILEKEGLIDFVVTDYKENSERLAELGMNLGIKYNLTKSKHVLLKLEEIVNILNEDEAIAISKTIELLDVEDSIT